MTQVRVGDRIAICGERGIVTEIIEGLDGNRYARIHFEGDVANYGQYQDKTYRIGTFTILG
jgi:hypothetical protein